MAAATHPLPSEGEPSQEAGAILVVALIFLAVGSFVILALAGLTSTNVTDTSTYRNVRVVDYAANGAVEGAIQQVRYHGACENFPKAGSLQLAINQYVFVTCQGTPITATASGSTLSSPSVPFVAADASTHQAVSGYPGSGTAKLTGAPTIASVSSDGTTATLTSPAASAGTVTVGTAFERLYTFYACTSSTPIFACSPSTTPAPEITAAVLFGDLKPPAVAGDPPTPATGYSATIVSWRVLDANA